MDLRNTQLKDTYGNLVTTGTTAGSPTTGGLQNGQGTLLTSVGIGTNDPSTELEVGGSSNTQVLISSTTNTGNSQLYFGDSDSDTAGVILYRHNGDSMAFEVNDAERLRIDSSGNVGIGTTSPSEKLQINSGYIKVVDNAYDEYFFSKERTDGSQLVGFQSHSAGALSIHSAGSEAMRIDSSGKVGIGTTSPTEKLQIVDSANDVHVRIGSGNAGINPTLRFHGKNTADTTNVYADIRVNPDNQTLGFSGTGTSGGSIEQDALVINSSGNVGIGSDNPGAKLHVSDTGSNQFYLERTGAITGKYRLGVAGANNRFYITDVAQSADRVVILENGNVGIGTASPDVELDVDGEIRASNGILFGTDTATANALDDYEEGTWTPVYAPTTGSFTTMTMDVVGATYTKIGRQVTVRAYIRTDEVVVGTASGVLKIDGLPFSCATGGQSSISLGYIKDWSTAPDAGYVNSASSSIFLHKTNASTNSDVADLTTGAVANQNVLILNLTYFV